MNLILDIGNSRIKASLFDQCRCTASWNLAPEADTVPADFDKATVKHVIVCATGQMPDLSAWMPSDAQVIVLDHTTPLPLSIDYATPQTLGPDRVAAACGAQARYKGKGCLVVDAGTCITIDYVDAGGTFRGGAIMPGLGMKLKALHTFTAHLPLLTKEDCTSCDDVPVCGRSTQEALIAGVVRATCFAIEGFASHYRRQDGCDTYVFTGGDAEWLTPWLQSLAPCHIPGLVTEGLNEILNYNQ